MANPPVQPPVVHQIRQQRCCLSILSVSHWPAAMKQTVHPGYMMICGSGTDSEISLCGSIRPPLMYSSSFTTTSSPSTLTFSMRASTQQQTHSCQSRLQFSQHTRLPSVLHQYWFGDRKSIQKPISIGSVSQQMEKEDQENQITRVHWQTRTAMEVQVWSFKDSYCLRDSTKGSVSLSSGAGS